MARLSVGTNKASAKQSRKDLLKREDAFINAAEGSAQWAHTNRKPLTIGGAAVLGAIIIGVIINGVLESRHDADAALLAKATDMLEGTVLPADSTDKANPDADPPTFATEKDRDTATRDAFANVATHSHGKQEQLARYMVADFSAKVGEKEAAEKELDKLLQDVSPADSLYFMIVERDAYLKEGRGDIPGAIATFARLKGEAFYADRCALQAARLTLAQGDKTKARSMLEKIQTEYAKSPVATQAKEMLDGMGAAPSAKAEEPTAPSAKAD